MLLYLFIYLVICSLASSEISEQTGRTSLIWTYLDNTAMLLFLGSMTSSETSELTGSVNLIRTHSDVFLSLLSTLVECTLVDGVRCKGLHLLVLCINYKGVCLLL